MQMPARMTHTSCAVLEDSELIRLSCSLSKSNLCGTQKQYSFDFSPILEEQQKWYTQARDSCTKYRATTPSTTKNPIVFVRTNSNEGEESGSSQDGVRKRWSGSSATTSSTYSWTSSDSPTLCESVRSPTPLRSGWDICPEPRNEDIDNLRVELRNALEELGIEITRLKLQYPRGCLRVCGANSSQSNRPSSRDKPLTTKTNVSNSLIPQPLRGSKRAIEEDEDTSENEDEDHKRRKGTETEDANRIGHSRYFACPFFKLDPHGHQDCMFKKLRTIATVKQHLSREHKIGPSFCDRCYHRFPKKDREEEIRQHHADDTICKKPNAKPWEYKMHEKINPRKGRGLSENETWFMIFETLFPQAYRPKSPFLGDDSFEAYVALLTSFEDLMHLDCSDFPASKFPVQYRKSFRKAQNTVLEAQVNEQTGQRQQEQRGSGSLNVTNSPQYEAATISFNNVSPLFNRTSMADIPGAHFTIESDHDSELEIPHRLSVPTPTSLAWVSTPQRPYSYQDSLPPNLYPTFQHNNLNVGTSTSTDTSAISTAYQIRSDAWSASRVNTGFTANQFGISAPRQSRQSQIPRMMRHAAHVQNQTQQNLHQPEHFQQDWSCDSWDMNGTDGT